MVINREKGKHYDPALIERAQALGEEIGVTRAARVLGVSPSAVQSWIKRKRVGMHMSSANTPEKKKLLEARQELQKLKRENEDLKKANLILKELASVFSKDRLSSSLERSLSSAKNGKKR